MYCGSITCCPNETNASINESPKLHAEPSDNYICRNYLLRFVQIIHLRYQHINEKLIRELIEIHMLLRSFVNQYEKLKQQMLRTIMLFKVIVFPKQILQYYIVMMRLIEQLKLHIALYLVYLSLCTCTAPLQKLYTYNASFAKVFTYTCR